MKEVTFSIPVSGIIRIDEESITVTVNKADTVIRFEPLPKEEPRISLERGRTMFDIVLETAREVVEAKGINQFSAAELYHQALRRYPNLKRNSWGAHVISCAPTHPSYRHYTSQRRYFRYLGKGSYSLDPSLTNANTAPKNHSMK